jgi:uncharacterized protein (DUF1684 family)
MRTVPIACAIVAASLVASACGIGGVPKDLTPKPDAEDALAPKTYADSIQAWRNARVRRLTSDSGWLTVAGLFWLRSGENTFGTDSSNTIVLPPGSAPKRAGSFRLDRTGVSDRVVVHADRDAKVRLAGRDGAADSLITQRALATDESENPDVLKIGRLTLYVIKRGDRLGIRMRDPESALRKEFKGLTAYPIDPAYRVNAQFEPLDPPEKIPVPNIAGYADSMIAPGRLAFVIDGVVCTLTPVHEAPSDTTLFIIFSDDTTELETYGGGRFLYANPPHDGIVVLDFNKAYNPPCAFTPFTTCPMPPEGNKLPVALRAGERKYAGLE